MAIKGGQRGSRPTEYGAEIVIGGNTLSCDRCRTLTEIATYQTLHRCDRQQAIALYIQEHWLQHSGIPMQGLSKAHRALLLNVADPTVKRRLAKDATTKHLSASSLEHQIIAWAARATIPPPPRPLPSSPPVPPAPAPVRPMSPSEPMEPLPSPSPTVKYHYTVADRAWFIIADGFIDVTDANIGPHERPAAWFSIEETWEDSANKGFGLDGIAVDLNRHGTELVGHGLVRFAVAPETAPVSWKEFKKVGGISLRAVHHLERTRKPLGGNPWRWWASFERVPAEKWLKVEVWTGSLWTEVPDLKGHLDAALAKPNPSWKEVKPFASPTATVELLDRLYI